MKNLLSRRRVSHAPGAGVVIHIVQKQAREKVRLILFLCLSLCRKAESAWLTNKVLTVQYY